MKKDIKEKWVAALRSGKYKQTTGALRKGDSFCCLGVLCDLVRDDLGAEWDRTYNEVTIGSAAGILPESFAKYCGLSERDPRIPEVALPEYMEEDGTPRGLSALNDNGLSFSEIADLIEKHVE